MALSYGFELLSFELRLRRCFGFVDASASSMPRLRRCLGFVDASASWMLHLLLSRVGSLPYPQTLDNNNIFRRALNIFQPLNHCRILYLNRSPSIKLLRFRRCFGFDMFQVTLKTEKEAIFVSNFSSFKNESWLNYGSF